ncbi:translation initiation factor IF-2-like [Onychostruthus taczanowskii]|uniref:translation initiation factor IF-2-like n=1 Tax=Onychostruthus taczanowskii TaxID=356909 RepID=UPI001B80AB65|nr:translation initiation factor IF-2-like [Onychostruthus taczanowskii]
MAMCRGLSPPLDAQRPLPGLTPVHITAVPAGGCCRTRVLVEMLRATLGCPTPSDGAGAEPQHGRASCGLSVPLLAGATGRQGGWARGPSLTAPSKHHPRTPRSPFPSSPPRQLRPFLPRLRPFLPRPRPFLPQPRPFLPQLRPFLLQLRPFPPGRSSPGSDSSHPAPRTQSRRGPAGEEPRPEHPGGGGSGLPRARRSSATPAQSPLTSPSAAGGTSAVLSVCQAAESSIRAAGRGGAPPAAAMSGTGATLRGHHATLREGLSELRARRDELSGRIQAEEAERGRLQARIATLSRRLSDTSESLAGLRSTRAHIDRTIAEMDIASGETLDNSQTLLDILKKEMRDLDKIIDPQNTSLGPRIRRQKRS